MTEAPNILCSPQSRMVLSTSLIAGTASRSIIQQGSKGFDYGSHETRSAARGAGVQVDDFLKAVGHSDIVNRLLGTPLGSESIRSRSEAGLEQRLNDCLYRRHSWDSQRLYRPVGLGDEHPVHGLGSVSLPKQFLPQFPKKPQCSPRLDSACIPWLLRPTLYCILFQR